MVGAERGLGTLHGTLLRLSFALSVARNAAGGKSSIVRCDGVGPQPNHVVMAGLVPERDATSSEHSDSNKAWMPGPRPGIDAERMRDCATRAPCAAGR